MGNLPPRAHGTPRSRPLSSGSDPARAAPTARPVPSSATPHLASQGSDSLRGPPSVPPPGATPAAAQARDAPPPSHAGTHCCSARPSVRPSWVSRQRPAPRTARRSLRSRRAQWAQYRGLGLTHSKCHLCAQPANLWPKKQYYSFYLFRATQKMALQSKLSSDPESCSHLGAYKPCTPPNSTDSLILKPASPAPPVGALRFLVSMPGRLFPQNGDRLRLSSGLSSAITTPDPPGHPSAPFSFILHCLQGSSI